MQEKKFFVHESSYVDDGVSIGEGTKIWHFSHISKGVELGAGCNLGRMFLWAMMSGLATR